MRRVDKRVYRVVRVSLPTRVYYTVQLQDGGPWGPEGAGLEIVRSDLSLVAAIRSRDFLADCGDF